MTPKVSIIVPIYNAGKFLEKCLDTLVNQTLKDIEIILVLDCPTDGSDRIAREYAEKDPRIRLIVNEQNLNIGLSRNEGLKIARGEYIGFSDHDDWRELDMYEKLYQKAREDQADIAISNFDSIYPDRIIPHPYYPDCPNQEQLKQEIFSTSSVTGKRSRSGDLLPIGGICGTSSTKEKSWKTTTYGFQITEKLHTKTCFF